MDLLARYLHAVKFFLPRSRQDDIARELDANLRSQMEDREEVLGRPLTDADVADILRAHGHPLTVAGRYRTNQQLIGPTFFPLYLLTLQAALAVVVLVALVGIAASAGVDAEPMRPRLTVLLDVPRRGLMVFAWVTLAFAFLDLMQSRLRLGRQWDPRRLPGVLAHAPRIGRQPLLQLVAASVALGCLLVLPWSPALLLGPAASFIEPAAVWYTAYVPIVGLTLATCVLHGRDVVGVVWTPARGLAGLVHRVLALGIFALLLRAGAWVQARPGAQLPGGGSLSSAVDVINRWCEVGLGIAFVVCLIGCLAEANQFRIRRRSAAPGASTATAARW